MTMFNEKQYREDGIIISTVSVPFMAWYGPYETGISLNNGKTWDIAEGYNSHEDAVIGHEKYCAMSKKELENLTFIG